MKRGASHGRGERGIALIVTMMAALVLAAVAGALVPLSTIETAIGANHRRAVEGLYAAEAALALVTAELGAVQDWSAALDGSFQSTLRGATLVPATPDGGSIDLPAIGRRLRNGGAGASGAGRGLLWTLLAHGPLTAAAPVPDGYGPWLVGVWIADDPGDPDSDPWRDANGAIMVHAAAFGPRRAERAVQATLSRRVLPPAPPTPALVRVRLASWRVVR